MVLVVFAKNKGHEQRLNLYPKEKMTPQINPAFARFVTHIEPPLPEDFHTNKYKIRNLEAGLTTKGTVRKRGSKHTRTWKRKKMKTEVKIKALAELDGWELVNTADGVTPEWKHERYCLSVYTEQLPNYLTSYDAIIPLVHKHINVENCEAFWNALNKLTDFFENEGHTGMLKTTPYQLCEALLRATGKWTEK